MTTMVVPGEVMVKSPAPTPVPESGMDCVPGAALSEIERVAVRSPRAEGVNVRMRVQEFPAAMMLCGAHVDEVEIAKSPPF